MDNARFVEATIFLSCLSWQPYKLSISMHIWCWLFMFCPWWFWQHFRPSNLFLSFLPNHQSYCIWRASGLAGYEKCTSRRIKAPCWRSWQVIPCQQEDTRTGWTRLDQGSEAHQCVNGFTRNHRDSPGNFGQKLRTNTGAYFLRIPADGRMMRSRSSIDLKPTIQNNYCSYPDNWPTSTTDMCCNSASMPFEIMLPV